jgi:hypothetical protein
MQQTSCGSDDTTRSGTVGATARPIRAGTLTADELLRRYCTHVHALTGSYQETARRLGIDRRTVRAKVDRRLLTELGHDDRRRR